MVLPGESRLERCESVTPGRERSRGGLVGGVCVTVWNCTEAKGSQGGGWIALCGTVGRQRSEVGRPSRGRRFG